MASRKVDLAPGSTTTRSNSVDGDLITVIHGDGTRTLRWAVDGDTLTLDSITTTLGPTGAIPDEVCQVALYMTAVFMKQG
jgi:hypothetical protein